MVGTGAHLVLAGCATIPTPQRPEGVETAPVAVPESDYRLQRGDVLDVKFFYTPELNENLTIRPDGKIGLQLIGEVDAAGLSTAELVQTLRDRYGQILVNPELAVLLRRFAGERAYVGGEVANPGLIVLEGRPTVVQALIQVGWLKKSAEPRNIVILRNTATGPTALFVDVGKRIQLPAETPDVALQSFDVVYVPKTTVAQIHDFIEQYIDKLVPETISKMVGFNFVRTLNSTSAITTTTRTTE